MAALRPLLLALGLLLVVAPSAAQAVELVGAIHEHSGYSDGKPGTRPADYYAAGRANGLDYVIGTEHAENLPFPGTLNEGCLSPAVAGCVVADSVEPSNALRKWGAAAEQATAASDAAFTGLRGFEWTSDRSGHLGVLFSRNTTLAYADGGNVTVDAFWSWFTRPASAGGGGDALAIFNHPGSKGLDESDPAYNWEDFAHEPAADARMIGMEVFNGGGDDGSDGPPEGWYARALDRGWHVGAVGAEDSHDDGWARPDRPKTVIDAASRAPADIRAALLARRFYATAQHGLRMTFTVDGAPMGSRLRRAAGSPLQVRATATAPGTTIELLTSGGKVVATGAGGRLVARRGASSGERWYVARVKDAGGKVVAWSSPVWVTATGSPRTWLAGDLHVHSCASHDVFCGTGDEAFRLEPGDDPQNLAEEGGAYVEEHGPELYTLGLPVAARFAEAAARGLDFLAITDHNDTRSAADEGFGTSGVLGVPGYENSLRGHAQMLGADRVLDNGDSSPAAVRALRAELHAGGGVLQANHPGYDQTEAFPGCDSYGSGTGLHWKYGFDVEPDTVELLNPTSPALVAEQALDCLLARGATPAVTGGSDSHWASIMAAQGAGNPTTWVLADASSVDGVLEALREGRTAISRQAPAQGGAPLVIEHDADSDGAWQVAVGEQVAPGTPLRVRSLSPAATGLVTVTGKAGAIVEDEQLAPGGSVAFDAPASGWARAVLTSAPRSSAEAPGCEPSGAPISTCAYDASVLALTSPAYVRAPGGEGAPGGDDDRPDAGTPRPTPSSPSAPPAASAAGSSRSGAATRSRCVTRRYALVRTGRRTRRLAIGRTARCGRLAEFRLARAVVTPERPLRLAFRLRRAGSVEMRVGARRVRLGRRSVGRTHRLTLPATTLRRGANRITLHLDGRPVAALRALRR